MHSNDQCDSATLCDECHKKVHPARKINVKQANVHIASWAAIPRNLTVIAAHSTHDKRPEALSLIGYQTLLGLGWYILNGHLDTCIVEFNRRRLARLIGKNPDVSFNRSLERALKSLCHTGILQASHSKGNDIEVHLSRQYLELLIINPWFFPLHEVPTSRMCVLTLRLLLCMQGIKQTYRIGLKKLCGHLGILTTQPNKAQKAICSACEYIPWATISIKDGMCSFTLKKRKPVPIFSLRELITDAVRHGR
ncbi:MAG: hypothetical protein KAS32_06065 [Candidatus Peribacteraceae bacterium]|nr:hypothetical protein [Candidatus Peribacteraceae bacterium]